MKRRQIGQCSGMGLCVGLAAACSRPAGTASPVQVDRGTADAPVAKLVIEPQVFDTPEHNAFCEAISFNPWHSLPEHQPSGGLNRLRKSVYETSSKLRHELNLKAPIEPRENDT
jgi:hypothetical protein